MSGNHENRFIFSLTQDQETTPWERERPGAGAVTGSSLLWLKTSQQREVLSRARKLLLRLHSATYTVVFQDLVCSLCVVWRRKWQSTPVFLPGESHGRRSLVGYSPRVAKSRTRVSDFTFTFTLCSNTKLSFSQGNE